MKTERRMSPPQVNKECRLHDSSDISSHSATSPLTEARIWCEVKVSCAIQRSNKREEE